MYCHCVQVNVWGSAAKIFNYENQVFTFVACYSSLNLAPKITMYGEVLPKFSI